MPFTIEAEDKRTVIKQKLRQYFDGKIVRKGLDSEAKGTVSGGSYTEDVE